MRQRSQLACKYVLSAEMWLRVCVLSLYNTLSSQNAEIVFLWEGSIGATCLFQGVKIGEK